MGTKEVCCLEKMLVKGSGYGVWRFRRQRSIDKMTSVIYIELAVILVRMVRVSLLAVDRAARAINRSGRQEGRGGREGDS